VNLQEIKTDNTAVFALSDTTVQNIPANSLIFDQDPSLHGQLVFNNTKLTAGQGITVSSANRIRFENSSQLNALAGVFMQGAKTASLEVMNSTIISTNGQILMDQFAQIEMESAHLMASVIKARVISNDGVLRITNSTLDAGSLLRLYAEGSRGTVEFAGSVRLGGRRIDIAGNTVRVKASGNVTLPPDPNATTIYAKTREYNKAGFGTIGNHQQQPFEMRPSFSNN
jgi:hypothetical protein